MLYCTLPGHPSLWAERRGTGDIGNLLELGTHLHNRVPDEARVQGHGLAQRVLGARARVEAHDEVVSVVMCRLQLLRGLGEEEGPPVGDATHDAVALEDDSACGFGDSKACQTRGFLSRGHRAAAGAAARSRVELLFHFGEAARPDLTGSSAHIPHSTHTPTIHTTPIISYSMIAGVDCLSVWPVALSFAKSSRFRKTFAPASPIALSPPSALAARASSSSPKS